MAEINYIRHEANQKGCSYSNIAKRMNRCVWQNKSAELCKGKMQSPALNFCVYGKLKMALTQFW